MSGFQKQTTQKDLLCKQFYISGVVFVTLDLYFVLQREAPLGMVSLVFCCHTFYNGYTTIDVKKSTSYINFSQKNISTTQSVSSYVPTINVNKNTFYTVFVYCFSKSLILVKIPHIESSKTGNARMTYPSVVH